MQKEAAMLHKGLKVGAGFVGVGVGITTAISLASAKQFPPQTAAQTQGGFATQTYVTVARAVGPQLAQKIFSGPIASGQIPFVGPGGSLTNTPQGFNPFGPLNTATFSGIGLLVVDYAIHEFVGAKYGYKYVSPFLKAIAAGLIGGGIVGGVLDDPGPRGGGLSGSTSRGISAYSSVPGLSGAAIASNTAMGARGGGLP